MCLNCWFRGEAHINHFLIFLFLFFLSPQLHALEISPQEYQGLKNDTELVQSFIRKIETSIEMPKSYYSYETSYENYLASLIGKQSNKAELIGKIKQSSIILYGDDHANPRSQENLIWLLKQLASDTRAPNIYMLEWVEEKYQKYLDLFMESKIEEKELRAKIEFDKLWGFSWKDHFNILKVAKRLGIRVVAAENRVMSSGDEAVPLRSRDNHVVSKLVRLLQSKPTARIIVSYGEYHLTGGVNDPHLKEKMERSGLTVDLVVYPQSNGYFWKFLETKLDLNSVEVIRFSDTEFYLDQGSLDKTMHKLKYYLKTIGAPSSYSIVQKQIQTDLSILTNNRSCRDLFRN